MRAGLHIGRHVVAQEHVDAVLDDLRLLGAKCVAEPARGLELDQRRHPRRCGARPALGPLLSAPRRRTRRWCRSGRARRCARDRPPRMRARCSRPSRRRQRAPSSSRHGRADRQDRVRTARRCTGLPACPIRHGRGNRRPSTGAWLASRSATGCQNRRSMASEWMSTTPFVALRRAGHRRGACRRACGHGGRHRSRACFQVWRTLWHANEQTPAVRPKGRKSKA